MYANHINYVTNLRKVNIGSIKQGDGYIYRWNLKVSILPQVAFIGFI
jgi:hypothetical protein